MIHDNAWRQEADCEGRDSAGSRGSTITVDLVQYKAPADNPPYDICYTRPMVPQKLLCRASKTTRSDYSVSVRQMPQTSCRFEDFVVVS